MVEPKAETGSCWLKPWRPCQTESREGGEGRGQTDNVEWNGMGMQYCRCDGRVCSLIGRRYDTFASPTCACRVLVAYSSTVLTVPDMRMCCAAALPDKNRMWFFALPTGY